jgi:hypothetical protein
MARVVIPLARVGDLPAICVCCGQPATRVRQQQFRINESLSAAALVTSVALGGLAWTERGITLTLPVCDGHRRRGRRSTQTLLWGTGLTVALGLAAYAASFLDTMTERYLAVGAMITFMATLVAGMHQVDDGLKVTRVTAETVTLAGVHRAFAEAAAGALSSSLSPRFGGRGLG